MSARCPPWRAPIVGTSPIEPVAPVRPERCTQLGDGLDRPHRAVALPGRIRERHVQRLELGPALPDRLEVRLDGRRRRPGRTARSAAKPFSIVRRISGSSAVGRRARRLHQRRGRCVQRHEEARRHGGRRVVGGPILVGELERSQAERIGEPECHRPRLVGLGRSRRRTRRRTGRGRGRAGTSGAGGERSAAGAARARRGRRHRSCGRSTARAARPAATCGDGAVRDAEQDEVGPVARELATGGPDSRQPGTQPCDHGLPDAAGADDADRFEHWLQFLSGYRAPDQFNVGRVQRVPVGLRAGRLRPPPRGAVRPFGPRILRGRLCRPLRGVLRTPCGSRPASSDAPGRLCGPSGREYFAAGFAVRCAACSARLALHPPACLCWVGDADLRVRVHEVREPLRGARVARRWRSRAARTATRTTFASCSRRSRLTAPPSSRASADSPAEAAVAAGAVAAATDASNRQAGACGPRRGGGGLRALPPRAGSDAGRVRRRETPTRS